MSGQLIGRGYITIAGLKDGDPAKTYVLLPSVESVTKKLDGTLSVKTVNCSVYKVTGSSAYALTSDHTVTFVRKPDGQTGTLAHPSGATGNVNILAATESVEFELKDGSKVIDRVRVPVLSDATDVNNELDTYNYLKEALEKQGTTMKPGLMLTSFIAVGYTDDGNVRHTQAGMNGIYVPKLGGRTPAAWYGGPMVDRFNADGTVNNSLAAGSYATSLIRMDGSVYFSNSNVGFNADGSGWLGGQNGFRIDPLGNVTMGNGVTISLADGSEKGIIDTLQSLTNFNIGITRLLAPCDSNDREISWEEAFNSDGNGGIKAKSLKAKVGFWGTDFMSCLGLNEAGGSGTGGGSAYGLYTDSTWESAALATDALGAQLGKYLKERIDNTYPKWQVDAKTFLADAGDGRTLTFALSKDGLATTDWLAAWSGNELRAISPAVVRSLMSVYTKAEVDAKNYLKDSGDGKTVKLAYSKAQLSTASWIAAWTVDGDAYELRAIAPATLRTLMDVYGKTETDGRISSALGGYATQSWVTSNFNKYSLPTASATVKGGVKVGSGLTIASETLAVSLSASHIPSLPWSKITTGKPTTLAGYGITDAKIANGVITLGGNTITPITSHQSLAAYLSKNEASNTYISKDGGDSYHVIMSNGNKTRRTLEYSELLTGGAVDLTNLQPNTLEPLVTRETLTVWDGSYVMGAGVRESALAYCTHGAFGDIVTHNAGEFLTSADISGLLKTDGSNGTSTGVSALINKLGEGTSTPGDNTYYVTSFAGTGTADTYHRRKHSALWTYIKGKADAVYQPKGSYLTAITKAQVEAVLTGNITSHTHSQYLTSHQSLANYVTLNTAQTITAKKTINILGLGEVSDDWNIPVRSNRLQWLLSSGTQAANAPGTYYSGVSFMTGYVGFQLAVYGSKSNERLYFRKVSDNGTWSGWHDIIHTGTADMLDTRYYTKTEINTKLTDGSVTKVGTASVGNGSRPVYLNAGVPTAGLYAFGINNGNAAIFVPFPTYTTLINGGYLRSDYASAGHPNSDFFKAILCWAIATYPAGGTLVGNAIPNAQGTCIINLYASTPDPDTKLPRYGSGIFITAVGDVQPFRVYNYDYTYSGRFQGLSDTATKLQTSRTLWGQSFNGGANVSGNMTGVGSIASTHGIAHNITDINTSVGTNAYWYGLGLHLGGQNNFVTLGGYFGLKLFTASGMVTMLDNGNVGIGVNPLYKLHVYGRTVIDNVDDYYALWLNKGGVCCDGGSGDVWNNGYGALNVGCFNNTNQTPLVVAYRNGSAAAHTGANRLFAMELLNSGAQLNFAFKGAALMSMFSDGTFYAKTGIWSDGYMSCKGNDTTSDARLKNVLGNFLIDIRRIADAPSIRFAWKDGSGVDVGSTAQYWQKINPCLAHERRDGMLGLQYGKAALLSVIAVAKKTVDIEERVAELERENTELRSRIAELERR